MPYIGRRLLVAKGTYEFATHGGAISTITLSSDGVQAGAVVLGGYLSVRTPPTSGGAATIALGLESTNDLLAAAAIGGAPWSTTGRKSLIPVFTGATTVSTTADRRITATVAAFALTAGAFDVYVIYMLP